MRFARKSADFTLKNQFVLARSIFPAVFDVVALRMQNLSSIHRTWKKLWRAQGLHGAPCPQAVQNKCRQIDRKFQRSGCLRIEITWKSIYRQCISHMQCDYRTCWIVPAVSTSPPGGNLVDGLPPVASLNAAKVWRGGRWIMMMLEFSQKSISPGSWVPQNDS